MIPNRQGWFVVSLGEVLWDRFEDGDRLGGAPANFAWHAHQLGADARLVSAVGDDEEGRRCLSVLDGMGFPTGTIRVDLLHDTGLVEVGFDGEEPVYRIIEDVAWDHLVWEPELEILASRADAVCYGTLAQRRSETRAVINRFLDLTRSESIRFFDVNLREEAPDRSMVERGLQSATVLKLNLDELDRLASLIGWVERGNKAADRFLADFDLSLVVQTLGAAGCRVFSADGVDETAARRVDVADTVGAGDAFGAAFCVARLNGNDCVTASDLANQVAGYVASKPGGMPVLPGVLAGLFATGGS